jgi:riboflavin kinase/FMN adenylyltransferase
VTRVSQATLGLDELPAVGQAALTMGVFDGVHRGHRLLLEATRDSAAALGIASAVLVFDPHPDEVLHPGAPIERLAPLAENLRLIAEAGIDHALPLRFDDGLRSLSPETFVARLAPAIALRALVMTPSSAFGRGRSGTPERLREIGGEQGFEVSVVEPLTVDGDVVSSSRIRAAIRAADLDTARELLGRAPELVGIVVRGDGRGRELGFPTANLAFDYRPMLPPLGIYLGAVEVADRDVGPGHPALVSIGVRPTFHSAGEVLVEVYLLDWGGDLYDARLRVQLTARLREERRFASVDALIDQMQRDEVAARARLRLPAP